jgi:hypothetical protein
MPAATDLRDALALLTDAGALEWSQVFATATLHVRRVKKGSTSTHPLRGDEMRALRGLQRESAASPFKDFWR